MRKVRLALATIILLAFSTWIYGEFFSKSSQTYAHMKEVKVGMTKQEAIQILSVPDTIYFDNSTSDSTQVLEYNMGFGAPDALRVFIKQDTVAVVSYNL